MITEKEISKRIDKTIKSPIRIGSLTDLKIDKKAFLTLFKPFFNLLEDDIYLIREKQITFLKKRFEAEKDAIDTIHKPYFEKKTDTTILQPWLNKLNTEEKALFESISTITRQRNISSFLLEKTTDEISVQRIYPENFNQQVDDFRSWERVFKQAEKEVVENALFSELLQAIFKLIIDIHPNATKLKITSHFMRTITQKMIKGENSPEGVHEDGTPYIVSALVINRDNITGAQTQIYENVLGKNNLIFEKALNPGEFAFQADTGEEKTFGNDLWHYVTPINPIDISKKGIRDIIGFDIELC